MRRSLLAVTLVPVLGCAGVHPYHPNFYSIDGDIRLGQQLQKEVESEVTPLRLSALTQLVNSIGQRLQQSAPDPAFKLFPYTFHVVDSPEVNAFALPGGPIYINSALVELCDTEDQLASVIGHEMGHVAARHATEMLTTQNLTQLALIAAVSVIPVPVPPIAWEGTKLGYVLGLLSYSRGKEAKEHPRGEHTRLVQEPFERLWPAVLHGLDEEGLGVAQADRARGTIATRPTRYRGADVQKKLAEIADLSRARRESMARISELDVTYYLLLAPAGEGTSVRIRSAIDAVDRSEAFFLGPGVFQVLPRHVDVPSRGVAAHDLMRRLVANLFTTEEMLFMLGELGVD